MDLQVFEGDLISSPSSQYEVQDLLGSGCFGVVTQCRKVNTTQTVALKIHMRKECIEAAKEEAEILKLMKEQGSDDFNIVTWNDSFIFEGRFYLEFEKLDISLRDFLQKRKSLELKEVRPIIKQLATALDFLKSIEIVHTDLKPDNIMMVDHVRQPLRVKVIDFGLARNNPDEWTGANVQARWYRSPEVLLGAPFNEAIDVWSLGCIAAKMLNGTTLFPGCDTYDMMRHIFYTVGKPSDHVLNVGLYTTQYFRPNYHILDPPLWRFMSTLEVRHFTSTPRTINSLEDFMKASHDLAGEDGRADQCDRASFVDLLTKLLAVDACDRITPRHILQHPFVTMTHLVGVFDHSLHVKSCVELMSVCQDQSCKGGEDVAKQEASNSTANPACHHDEGHSAGLSNTEQPPHKRKYEGDEKSESGSRSTDSTSHKRRRTQSLVAAETVAEISPPKSLPLKRTREEADPSFNSNGDSPSKKMRSVNLEKQLMDSAKQLLNNTEEAWFSSTQMGNAKKRQRTDEEASSSESNSPDKKRRGSPAGEQ